MKWDFVWDHRKRTSSEVLNYLLISVLALICCIATLIIVIGVTVMIKKGIIQNFISIVKER